VAGAPFFFGEGDGDGVGLGVSPDSGVALGLTEGVGDSSGEGLGVGDAFRFFFLLDGDGEDSGDGLGEDFFFLVEADGLGDGFSEGRGLEEAFFFFGDGDFSGDAVGFGEGDFSGVAVGFGVGDFAAVDFFFVRLRGAGVGVGWKIFLSLVPSDSSAAARTGRLVSPTRQARTTIVVRAGRMASDSSTRRRLRNARKQPVIPRQAKRAEGPHICKLRCREISRQR
jgi:hypothetical protein